MPLDPVKLAQQLIQCPSVTPHEGGALDLLQSVLEDLGFTCTRLPFQEEGTDDVDNLYARLGDGAPNLCFAGHTDVVPVGDRDGWNDDPFQGLIKDGMLYGRGAADMKGAIASWVAAVSAYLEEKGQPHGSFSLLITGDEEGPSINGTKKMLPAITKMGEKLDACVTGEPTNPKSLGEMVKIGRRGSLNVTITVTGVQGHTGYPHLADNAAHRLVAMLKALTDWEIDQGSDHFQPSTLAISTIDIDNPATNIIPGTAKAVFNIRFNDLHTSDSLEKQYREILDAAIGEGGQYELDIKVSGESFLTPPGLLSDLVSDACEKVTGQRPELSTTGGTSDSRFIKDYCPVLDFGLVGQTMHKTNECVAVSDVEALAKIYQNIIEGYFEKVPS
ncbi:succinyl-diaminopimelate desuccinylase [Aestuariispira insulae]|uniref:Succinyl-diaminopimelate desuccinylase n=1 Tax=Aestuariispira insulae TaxID=1461337 RepID=A0A3D9HEZ2_9PROT|nr:succinyl-diaminopimelate desuccinylase [Aestuariispira insulae]RED48049.1 succinyldiaminopimelate desuccinylase [Aestuariispira insulae]